MGGINKLQADGTLVQIAGPLNINVPCLTLAPDGTSPLDTCIDPGALGTDSNGTLYFYNYTGEGGNGNENAIRRIGLDGLLSTVVGYSAVGPSSPGGEGAIATQTGIGENVPFAVAPDGSLYVNNSFGQIRHIAPALPGYTGSQYLVPTADGRAEDIFDETGRHLSRFDALTGVALSQFSYDPSGRITSVTDSNGLVTTLTYGSSSITVTGPYGVTTQLALDANGMLQSVTDALGDVSAMAYAAGGLLTSFTTPNGGLHTMTYDSVGRLVKDLRPDGASFTLSPQNIGAGWSTTVSTALGVTTSHAIATVAPGLVTRTTTDPAGLTSTSTQTSQSSTTLTVPDGTMTAVTVGPDPRFGSLSPVTTSGVVTLPSGLASTTSVARTATLTASNGLSQWTEATTVNGNTWTTAYSAATSTFTTTSPMGRTTTTVVDAAGRPIQLTTPEIASTQLVYDTQGRLQTSTQGTFLASGQEEPRTWAFGYDANGYPNLTTDPLAVPTSYQNDALGRTLATFLPGGTGGPRDLQATFDGDNNNTSETLPSGALHQFTYTPVDALASYEPPSLGAGVWSTQYIYDGDGRISQETRPDGSTIGYAYDLAGRLSTTTYPQGTTTRTYSPTTGQLVSLATSAGETLGLAYDGFLTTGTTWSGTVPGALLFGYDASFRITSQTLNGAALSFGYDNDNLMTQAGALSISRDSQNGRVTGTTLGGVTDAYAYDANGALAAYVAEYEGTSLYSETIGARDGDGRITDRTENVGSVTHEWMYEYDTAGRLTDVTEDGTPVSHYTYDVDDNRTSYMNASGTTFATYDAQDQLLTYGGATYSYGSNGELQGKSEGGQATSYTYDVFGNLLNATLPSGEALEYVIDGQHRRVGKQVNGTLATGFLYQDQLKTVTQLDANGNVVSRFVFGSKPNVPDYYTTSAGTFRILSDHLGSPRLVVNTANGSVVEEIDYDEFGNVTNDTAPGTIPLGFAGGLRDLDTGLIRFGARDYDPSVGRWTSKDPIRFDGSGLNFYVYAWNDPVDLQDPTGRVPIPFPIVAGSGGGEVFGPIGALAGALGGFLWWALNNPADFPAPPDPYTCPFFDDPGKPDNNPDRPDENRKLTNCINVCGDFLRKGRVNTAGYANCVSSCYNRFPGGEDTTPGAP